MNEAGFVFGRPRDRAPPRSRVPAIRRAAGRHPRHGSVSGARMHSRKVWHAHALPECVARARTAGMCGQAVRLIGSRYAAWIL